MMWGLSDSLLDITRFDRVRMWYDNYLLLPAYYLGIMSQGLNAVNYCIMKDPNYVGLIAALPPTLL